MLLADYPTTPWWDAWDRRYKRREAADYAAMIATAKTLMGKDPKPEYCGVEIIGGWCKRQISHPGQHTCC